MGGTKDYLSTGGFASEKYKEVCKVEGIKILEKKGGGSVGLPMYSNTQNAVYATVRPDGHPKQIQFYDNQRKQYKRIDLDHVHNGKEGVHVQNFNDTKTRYKLSKKEKRIVKLYEKEIGGK